MADEYSHCNFQGQRLHVIPVLGGGLRITVDDKVDIAVTTLNEIAAVTLRDFLNRAYPVQQETK